MTKMEYANKVAEKINGAVVKEVTKNNGVILTGIAIQGDAISPCVYIDEAYKNGIDVAECAENVKKAMESSKNKIENDEISGILDAVHDFEVAKSHIIVRMVNAEMNPDVGGVPHRQWNDLLLTYRIQFDDKSVSITDQIISQWGITEKELYNTAILNMDPKVSTMGEMLSELCAMDPEEIEAPGMYIITDRNAKQFGAGAIMKAKFDRHMYLLPSSIHEWIAVNMPDVSVEALKGMVKEVNNTQVIPEEVLSYNVYEYDPETKQITIAA